jgi:UDP-glucose 4-epimerase
MKLLITGTNGFVGRNLKEYFQARYEDVLTPRRQELNLLDSDAVRDYVAGKRFDVVLHCGVTLVDVEQNLKMYFNLERCSKSFGKMILVGSGAEYDKTKSPPKVTEDRFGLHIPQDIYGFSKYVIAKDVEAIPRNIYNLRVFGIYGKYEDYRRRFISNNICRVLSGMGLSLNRNTYFDYLYVDDFARMLELFMKRDPKKRSYNVGTGEPIDLLSLAKMIQAIDGRGASITVKQDGLNPEYSCDTKSFHGEFGAFEFTPVRSAVAALYGWYRDSGDAAFDKSQL